MITPIEADVLEEAARAIDPAAWARRDEDAGRRAEWDADIHHGWGNTTFEEWVERSTKPSIETARVAITAYLTTKPSQQSQPGPLVEFFRGPGDAMGRHGDYEMWSTEQTAVYFLTKYLRLTNPPEWPVKSQPPAADEVEEAIRLAYKRGYMEGCEDADGNFDRESCEEGWQQYLADNPISQQSSEVELREALDCHGLDTPERVCFYEQDFYVLSNFSAFNLYWKDMTFHTLEAAYHWEKFAGLQSKEARRAAAAIWNAPSAHEAFKLAERNRQHRRPDWDFVKVTIMRDLLWAKVEQHEYVKRKLLATGDRELVENSWRDDFWGWGPNRDGQNMLGKLWMEVRAEIRTALARSQGEGV